MKHIKHYVVTEQELQKAFDKAEKEIREKHKPYTLTFLFDVFKTKVKDNLQEHYK
jgi:hypothetical protein